MGQFNAMPVKSINFDATTPNRGADQVYDLGMFSYLMQYSD